MEFQDFKTLSDRKTKSHLCEMYITQLNPDFFAYKNLRLRTLSPII